MFKVIELMKGINLRSIYYILLFTTLIMISGCAQRQFNEEAPSGAIENYLEARISKDSNTFIGTYCADFEFDALTEFDSFGAVEATLENMACITETISEGQATVTCSGTMEVVYDGESSNSMDLGRFAYVATLEDDEWQMCGYNTSSQ